MKFTNSIFLLMIVSPAFGQIKAKADLQSVTVYSNGAELNHTAKANVPGGTSEVVIDNVAGSIDENSVRVGANSNITIMSVSFAKNYLREVNKTPDYLRVEDSIKMVNRALAKINNEIAAEQGVLQLLKENGKVAGANTGLNVAELMKMADYSKSKQLEATAAISSLEEQRQRQYERLQKLNQQLSEMNPDAGAGGQLVLQLMAANSAPANFEINYITPEAGWSPYYDLRASSTAAPLEIAYKANVVQNTGIDWEKVKLTLSTSNPSISSTAPILGTWFLQYGMPQYSNQQRSRKANYATNRIQSISETLNNAAPGVDVANGGSYADTQVRIRGNGSISGSSKPIVVVDGAPFDGVLEDINPNDIANVSILKDATATSLYGARGADGVILITTKNKNASNYAVSTENDLNATFDISIPYDVASNNKPHSVLLQEHKLPVQYKYYAVPKADPDAFLMAELSGYDKLNLLPGEANIIFNNMYVGKSFINPGGLTDTLNLSMGRDKKVIVKRERIADETGVKFIGSSKKHTLTYDITVRNGKKEAVNLLLKDQYPIATDKDMEVELLQSSDAMVNKETGVLTWKLKLAPGETKKVRLSYSVKYPKDKILSNL